MRLLLLLSIIGLAACGGGGDDASKDGDTNTDIGGSNVVVNPNIINNSAPVTINISPDSEAKDAKSCDSCHEDYDTCTKFGERTSGKTDEQCLVEYNECLKGGACSDYVQPEASPEQSTEVFYN